MGLPIPNLDDKTFDQLVQDARSLITQYAPGWTDHNVHDPGITFIELFAWLAEMQIYQVNRVTDKNYEKFLKLVGIHPAPAQPAKIDITFHDIRAERVLSAGTQIGTEIDDKKMVFKTEEDINLIPSSLKKIITKHDSLRIDNTEANETDDIYFFPFGENAQVGATLEIGFDKSFPFEKKEIQITFILFEDDLPSLKDQRGEPIPIFPSSKVVWEYLSNGKWNELVIKKDTTQALTNSGKIVFDGPLHMDVKDNLWWIHCRLKEGHYEIVPLVNSILLNTVSAVQIETIQNEDLGRGHGTPEHVVKLSKTPFIKGSEIVSLQFNVMDVLDWPGLLKRLKGLSSSEKPGPEKQIWSRLEHDTQKIINQQETDQEPNDDQKNEMIKSLNRLLASKDLYEVEAFKGIKLSDEARRLVDKSENDCISDEEVRLLNRSLIEAVFSHEIMNTPLVIQVQEAGNVWKTWEKVDDFDDSGPDDFHYIFDPEKGEIIFGNGLNGRIPSESQKIRAFYKTTLGLKGNIPKGQRFLLNTAGSGVIAGINYQEAQGGRDAESIDNAKGRAKKDFRERYRAITSEDYEELARATPGLRVARAKAIPNYNSSYPNIRMPGVVTVVVVPYTREGTTRPLPGEGFLQTVSRYLDTQRLITTDVHVIRPEYVSISVMCRVHIKKKSSPDEVRKRVNDALKRFLDPLQGGPDKKGWPFGRAVYPSEIYQVIDNEEGVEYVTHMYLSADVAHGQYRRVGDIIQISPVGLVYSGNHMILTDDEPVEYVKISVKCKVRVKEKSCPTEVKRNIQKALEDFLDPIKGGMDGKGWPQGHPVYTAEIRTIIGRVDGVDTIEDIRICTEGQPCQKDTIRISSDAYAVSGEHQVEVL